jgi:hypothetical protein
VYDCILFPSTATEIGLLARAVAKVLQSGT